MVGPLYIHEAMRGIGHGIGAEGARMMPKWGNRGKLENDLIMDHAAFSSSCQSSCITVSPNTLGGILSQCWRIL